MPRRARLIAHEPLPGTTPYSDGPGTYLVTVTFTVGTTPLWCPVCQSEQVLAEWDGATATLDCGHSGALQALALDPDPDCCAAPTEKATASVTPIQVGTHGVLDADGYCTCGCGGDYLSVENSLHCAANM
jgi:hypothetical protein